MELEPARGRPSDFWPACKYWRSRRSGLRPLRNAARRHGGRRVAARSSRPDPGLWADRGALVPTDAARASSPIMLISRRRAASPHTLALARKAESVLEGLAPGVMEHLGLGPDLDARGRNPGLVYGRTTGWGQQGPLAPRASHDIDSSRCPACLHANRTVPGRRSGTPLNCVGDFAGRRHAGLAVGARARC